MFNLEEMKKHRDAELALVEDESERMLLKIKWDLLINREWEESRREQFSKTPEEVEAEFLGTRQHIFGTRRRSHANRVVRKDDQGRLYVNTDGAKAIVEWNPVIKGLQIKHWEER